MLAFWEIKLHFWRRSLVRPGRIKNIKGKYIIYNIFCFICRVSIQKRSVRFVSAYDLYAWNKIHFIKNSRVSFQVNFFIASGRSLLMNYILNEKIICYQKYRYHGFKLHFFTNEDDVPKLSLYISYLQYLSIFFNKKKTIMFINTTQQEPCFGTAKPKTR